MSWLLKLPLWQSLQNGEKPHHYADDLIAGSITAALLVPQALAYALLAGLPAHTGLYACVLPPIVYALFGSSRSLAVGPVAVSALMVAHALSGFAEGDSNKALQGAAILAAEAGLFLLAMRVLGLGALNQFVSHPVLSGFTSGAAVLIIISQLPALLGVEIEAAHPLSSLQQLSQSSPQEQTLLLGGLCLLTLYLGRQPLKLFLRSCNSHPALQNYLPKLIPILVLIISAIWMSQHPHWVHVAVVGQIPSGLPSPNMHILSAQGWAELAPSAALIALIGYVESISVAQVLAQKSRQHIDANQELSALGLSNLAAASVGSMPVAGGFSRSIVNHDAGAKSQLAAIVTALIIACIALFFVDVFGTVPKAALAAMIVIAVAQLIDYQEAIHVFRYAKQDGITWVGTFLGVLFLGIEWGLLCGITLAISLYLRRSSHPHIALLGRVPGTEHFRNVERHLVECLPKTLIVRIDENLYFASIQKIEKHLTELLEQQPQTRQLLLLMSAVNFIDASAAERLETLIDDWGKQNIELHIAELKGPVQDALQGTRLWEQIQERVHLSGQQAWTHLSQKQTVSSG